MLELHGLTFLEVLNRIYPFAIWGIILSIWTLLVRYLTQIAVNRKWLKDPKQVTETAREHIRQRDEIIHRQQKEIARLKYHNKNMWAALRSAQNAVNSVYDSGNEGIYKKKEAS